MNSPRPDKREAPAVTEASQDQPSATGHPEDSAIHEPTAWLRGRINHALATIDRHGLRGQRAVLAPIGRTGGRHDRTCDRCGTYVPPGPPFYCDLIRPEQGVMLVIGLCQTCRDLERGEHR